MNAVMIASAARAAAPIAKPLPIAAGGVAELVQRVGDGAGLLAETAHLRDASGVVRDRAVGVDGHRDPDRREHPDRGHPDAVEADQLARHRDDCADGQDGNRDRAHADGEARDDDGGRSGIARARDLAHRAAGGEVLGHQPDHDAADRAATTAHQTRQSTPIISVMT